MFSRPAAGIEAGHIYVSQSAGDAMGSGQYNIVYCRHHYSYKAYNGVIISYRNTQVISHQEEVGDEARHKTTKREGCKRRRSGSKK